MRFSREPRDLDNVDADLKQFISITPDPDADASGAEVDVEGTADGEVVADMLSRDLRDILNECPLRLRVLGDLPGGGAVQSGAGCGFSRSRSCLRIPTRSSST
jgi:hypothetical protein